MKRGKEKLKKNFIKKTGKKALKMHLFGNLFVGVKKNLKKGGGMGMIEMHNIYPYLKNGGCNG